jgi:hypothetical protein
MARLSAPRLDLKVRADLLVVPIQRARGDVERVSDGSRRLDRTWLTMANGMSCNRGRWPRRWNTLNSTASVSVDEGPRAVAWMKARSSTVGV